MGGKIKVDSFFPSDTDKHFGVKKGEKVRVRVRVSVRVRVCVGACVGG